MVYKKYRPCIAGGKKAIFHRWADHAELIDAAAFGSNGGVIKWTTALVEYEDGRVAEVLPREIRFTEPPHRDFNFNFHIDFTDKERDEE